MTAHMTVVHSLELTVALYVAFFPLTLLLAHFLRK